ncbi:MAG TPA: acetyl-CoA C-acetyltransferase [Pirellulales bacterium]|nr:acetyl-CoA C-acetyltransferase [Pirellulales bacterium]
MSNAYVVAGCRTPIGKLLGSLSAMTAPELGAIVVRESLRRAGVPSETVDEVILGNVLTAGLGQAPARQAALRAGLPPTIAALTINKMCGSGLKAVMLADQVIRAGDARCIVAGGMESMSRSPYLLSGARQGWKFGSQQAIDSMIHDGLWCAIEDLSMGAEADYIASRCGITRHQQDEFSLESHRRATRAIAEGAFDSEIVSVEVPGRKGSTVVRTDEGPRSDASLEALTALKSSFESQENVERTVTAGNASQISDGAAAVVVVDEGMARECSATVKARIVATATSGVPPKDVFIAPVDAIQRVLSKAGLKLADIDLIELNEAFAAQALACDSQLHFDREKLNVNGGAIALGHPIGASGARVLVTLLYALAARGLRRGLAALCLGGGNAVAMIVERD